MCTNFVPSARHEIAALSADMVLPSQTWPLETYPGYMAPVLLRAQAGALQCRVARFGLVPHWCKDLGQANSLSRKTYNARSETAAHKPSYRHAWRQRQWAVAPMQSYFEPCWENAHANAGRSERWQMALAGAAVFGAAGLWDCWVNPQDGAVLHSFAVLTVNADGHGVMGRMHRSGEEKRMPVLLGAHQFADWLQATPPGASDWMRAWPAEDMVAAPAARPRAAPKERQPVGQNPAQGPHNLSLF